MIVEIIKKSKKQMTQILIQAQMLIKKNSQILRYKKTNLKKRIHLMRGRSRVQKNISQPSNLQISI